METTLVQTVTTPAKRNELTPIEREIGILLRYDPKALDTCNPDKVRLKMQARLVAIQCGEVCPRCCGTGEYSWCQAYGSTCFQCSGSGYVVQRITPKVMARAKEQIAAGHLDEHLAFLKTKKECQAALETVSHLAISGGCFPIRLIYIPSEKQRGAFDIYDLTDGLTVLCLELDRKLNKEIKPLKEIASQIQYNRKLRQAERNAKVVEFHAQWTAFKINLQDAKKQLREHPGFGIDRIYHCPTKDHNRYQFFFNEEFLYS